MTIELIIQQLEEIKGKGLMLSLSDLEKLIRLYDDCGVLQIEYDSQYTEFKNEIDNQKAIAFEKYKAEEVETTDAKGNTKMKAKYVDEVVKSMIKQEFQEQDVVLATMRATTKMTEHKRNVVEHYINLVKIVIK